MRGTTERWTGTGNGYGCNCIGGTDEVEGAAVAAAGIVVEIDRDDGCIIIAAVVRDAAAAGCG